MRGEREIREKINSLMEAFSKAKKADIGVVKKASLIEDIAGQIDMLLWVVEDETGYDPLDERIDEILNKTKIL